jgi:hypothetical protein
MIFNPYKYFTSDGLTPVMLSGRREFSGIGFVVLNLSQDRDKYITNCYRTNTVTIITTNQDIIKNCIVPKSLWNDITFPVDNFSKGSQVTWLNMYRQEIPIILNVLEKKQEYSKKTELTTNDDKIGDNGSYSFRGDGKNAFCSITVDSLVEQLLPMMKIKVLHAYTKGLFDLYVQGKIQIETDDNIIVKALNGMTLNIVDATDIKNKNTIIEYLMNIGFTYSDQFNNNITINKDGFVFKDNNKNTFQTSANGMTFTDVNNNSIEMTKSGMTFTDVNNAKIETSASGILIQKDNVTLKQILTLIVEGVLPIVTNGGVNPIYSDLTQALTKIEQLLS